MFQSLKTAGSGRSKSYSLDGSTLRDGEILVARLPQGEFPCLVEISASSGENKLFLVYRSGGQTVRLRAPKGVGAKYDRPGG